MKRFLLSLIVPFLFFIVANGQQTYTNNMNASLVVGQADFTSNNTTYNQSTTVGASYTAVSPDGKLAIALQHSGGLFLWNNLPTNNGAPADVVVGNSGFSVVEEGCTQSLTRGINGVAFSPDGQKLIISDTYNHRVLIWNTIPTANGQPADVVLGQSDFVSGESGSGNSKFNKPAGVFVSPDGKLFLSDRDNHRVLIWNSIPTVSNTPADIVVGQPDFNTVTTGTDLNKMNSPFGLWVSPDGKLLVSDEQNHRVLVFNTVPTSNGATANVVFGRTGTAQTAANRLRQPVGVTVSPDGKVFIGDFANHRVLIFNSIPDVNEASADLVLGQTNFTNRIAFNPSGNPSASNMRNPYNVSTDINGRLYLAGRDMNRVMVFGTQPAQAADLGVEISGATANVCSGSQVTFKVKVTNNSAVNATGVIVTTALPALFNYSSHLESGGVYNATSGYWNIGNINAGESKELELWGEVNVVNAISLNAYANVVQSNQMDNNYSNNATSVNITVHGGSAPTGGVLNGPTASFYGQTVTYSLDGVTGAVDYIWEVTGAVSVAGFGNSRQITFGNQPVQITVVPVSATCTGRYFSRQVSLSPGYQSQWVLFNTDFSDWCPGESREVEIKVKNIGGLQWLASPDFQLAYWWNGQSMADGYRIDIPQNVNPGEEITLKAVVTAPTTSGSNNLNFDIVKIGCCAFADNNGECGPDNIQFSSPDLKILNDQLAPTPDIAVLPTISGECSVTVSTVPTATDNCAGQITATTTDALTYTTQGTYTITWKYDDGHGNISTQQQTVEVKDVTAPVPNVAVLPTISGECSVTIATAPTATDNCAGQVTGTTTDALTYTTQGTYTINWKYDDGNGNTSTQQQTVEIKDLTAPVVISSPSDITVPVNNTACSAVVSWSEPIVTDNCSAMLTIEKSHVSGQVFPLGTTLVTYTFKDGNGNSSSCSFNVIVTNNFDVIAQINHVTCFGAQDGSIVLTPIGGQTPYSYHWDNGFGVSKDLTELNGGTYSVIATDAFGCVVEKNYVVNEPDAINVAVTMEGNVLKAANTSADDYQWIRVDQGNAFIPMANQCEYLASATGVYAVIITQGSCSAISNDIEVITSGTFKGMENQSVSVYPNPNQGKFVLDFGKEITNGKVRISDLNGMLVFEKVNVDGYTLNVNISEKLSGLYIVEVVENNHVNIIKIVKQ